jgi:CubicO group peptidase (beta-lactamase class C family)
MSRATKWLGTLTACAVLAGGASPARGKEPKGPPKPRDPELAAKIGAAVRAAGGPDLWGTVLVTRGEDVLYLEAFGYADYATKANAADTLYEIASASKQVTAAAVLRLEQQKKLRTSDPLTRFFRDAPEDKRAVTLDHLLHHTAGLAPDLGVAYGWGGSRPEYARLMLERALVNEPGKVYAYSNVGYALLAAVVEEVTGKDFEEYVRRELFVPAGLVDTGFVGDKRLVESPRITKRRAPDALPDWTAAKWFWGWGYRGMGGVVTTVLDLWKWDRALRGDKVLGEAAKAKLYAPGLAGYACGWQVETTPRGTTKVSHGGGVRGYGCTYARWLEEDVMVAVLSNGVANVHAVEKAASDLLFPPVRVEADLDAQPYDLDANGAFVATADLAFDLAKDRDRMRLVLRHAKHELAVVRAPKGVFQALAGSLEGALGQSAYPDPAEPAAMEGGLYQLRQLSGGGKRLHLDEGVEIAVLPAYSGRKPDGTPVEDPRTVLLLRTARAWPLMVKMNPRAARALLDTLKKALA